MEVLNLASPVNYIYFWPELFLLTGIIPDSPEDTVLPFFVACLYRLTLELVDTSFAGLRSHYRQPNINRNVLNGS